MIDFTLSVIETFTGAVQIRRLTICPRAIEELRRAADWRERIAP